MNQRDEIECLRCGKCCLANVLSFTTDEDMKRWRREGRQDILHIIEHWHPIWAGDHLISTENGRYLHGCPFLRWDDHFYTCTIYDSRPGICIQYKPGSSQICPQWHRV